MLKKLLCVCVLSRVQLLAAPCTVACQVLYMEFSRQECWSGLPFPSPGDLPDPGIEPGSPALEADTLTSEPGRCVEVKCNPLVGFISLYIIVN